MTLYTRSGDDGSTGLFGGDRVMKDHPRVAAYGDVDELNAHLGLAASVCGPDSPYAATVVEVVAFLQSRLFDLGADLATPDGGPHASRIRRMKDDDVLELESWIDRIDAGNEPMKHFILPGGTEPAARLHVARTVCRRAERRVVTLAASERVTPAAAVYLNRVSDLLFALARRVNREAGVEDVPWRSGEEAGN